MKLAILAVFLITLLAIPAHAVNYTLTNLGYFNASKINNTGHVIGSITTDTGFHASLWKDGQITDLGTLGSYWSTARGFNDNDQIVGTSADTSGNNHAFLWQGGSMVAIAGNDTEGYDINNSGQVIGNHYGRPGAFLWENGTEMIITSLITNSYVSNAKVINNNGQVLVDEDRMGYYIWDEGQFTRPRMPHPYDINDTGQIVGSDDWAGYITRPCMLDNGMIIYLGQPRSESSWASRINNNGLVLGGYLEGGSMYSFLWQDGQFTDPADLLPQNSGWSRINIVDINDVGQLLGDGMFGGQYGSFILTPVPEPSGLLMIGGGLVGVIGIIRRRR